MITLAATGREIADSIRESARAVLIQKGLRDVLEAAGIDLDALVREIGNNAAGGVVLMESE